MMMGTSDRTWVIRRIGTDEDGSVLYEGNAADVLALPVVVWWAIL